MAFEHACMSGGQMMIGMATIVKDDQKMYLQCVEKTPLCSVDEKEDLV